MIIHLERPLASEGDPDVVGEGDAPLVQEDPDWPRPRLWTEAVSGSEGHVGHGPGLTRHVTSARAVQTRGTWCAPGVAASPGAKHSECEG